MIDDNDQTEIPSIRRLFSRHISEKQETVLIVDDITENLYILNTILSNAGYDVRSTKNGHLALQFIKESPPDLILLDIKMPGIDGIEVCRRLRESPKTRNIPIILISALSDIENKINGFNVGAVDYITKPFNSHELIARVKTHLELRSSKRLIEKQREDLQDLLHVLCHDLTTPFNYIQLILKRSDKKPELLERKKSHLRKTAANGLEIIHLIRQICSIEERGLSEDLAAVNLKRAVNESLVLLHDKLEDKNITVVVEIDDHLEALVEKISFVHSVLNNILINAIKFSYPDSEIRINGIIADDQVELTITDHGIGIPESILDELFEYGGSTSRDGTKGEPGTGYGMPLMKKFVTAYHGDMEIHSKEEDNFKKEHGTSVCITLQNAESGLAN